MKKEVKNHAESVKNRLLNLMNTSGYQTDSAQCTKNIGEVKSRNSNTNKARNNYCEPYSILYAPTHDVAPRAVTMAVATDAMICTINFSVSFFVMVLMFNVHCLM